MSNKPRWFHRTQAYNNYYNEYQEVLCKYEKGQLKEYSEYKEVFEHIKNCHFYYCRVLNDILKTYNIKEFLPVRILTAAQFLGEHKLIDDADIWLDFIGDVNELAQTRTSGLIMSNTIKIIEKYKDKVEKQYITLNNYLKNSNVHDDEVLKELNKKTKPKYNAKEIGITKTSYNKLINLLKKTDYIKYAWLHGSRTKGNARFSSDIDLIADIPFDKQDEIRSNAYSLNIPYRVDIVSINNVEQRDIDFIRTASQNVQIIYRAEDFRKD